MGFFKTPEEKLEKLQAKIKFKEDKRKFEEMSKLDSLYNKSFKKSKSVKVDSGYIKDSKITNKNFISSWMDKLKDRYKPSQTILVEMLNFNGTISHFMIAAQEHKFYYKKMAYIVDEDRRAYCTTTKLYMYRFHEGFALPFKLEINSVELKDKVLAMAEKFPEIDAITTSFNPFLLVDVLKFEYAKGVIQGAAMHEFLKRMFVLVIIILIIVFLHFIIHAYTAKWINIKAGNLLKSP